MLVKEIMTNKIVTIDCNVTILDACNRYRDYKVGCLIITDKDRFVGIVTERDILRKVVAKGKDPRTTSVYEIMNSPLITTHKDTLLPDALSIFRKHYIRRLLITDDDGKIVGIITHRNVVLSVPTTYFARQRARRSLLSAEAMI